MTGVVVKNMSFKAGQTLTITGIPKPDCTNFAINIGLAEDNITLHMNPRFDAHGDQNTVVCNSYEGGNWCEEQRENLFPFQHGEEFKLLITYNKDEFNIGLPDGSAIHFPNRLGAEKYQYIHFDGEAKLLGVEIK